MAGFDFGVNLAAWGELHPISRAILGFYSLNSEFEFSERNRQLVLDTVRGRARTISIAIQLLQYIVTHLGPNDVILFAPDVITYKAVKAGVFLARVSLVSLVETN